MAKVEALFKVSNYSNSSMVLRYVTVVWGQVSEKRKNMLVHSFLHLMTFVLSLCTRCLPEKRWEYCKWLTCMKQDKITIHGNSKGLKR